MELPAANSPVLSVCLHYLPVTSFWEYTNNHSLSDISWLPKLCWLLGSYYFYQTSTDVPVKKKQNLVGLARAKKLDEETPTKTRFIILTWDTQRVSFQVVVNLTFDSKYSLHVRWTQHETTALTNGPKYIPALTPNHLICCFSLCLLLLFCTFMQ